MLRFMVGKPPPGPRSPAHRLSTSSGFFQLKYTSVGSGCGSSTMVTFDLSAGVAAHRVAAEPQLIERRHTNFLARNQPGADRGRDFDQPAVGLLQPRKFGAEHLPSGNLLCRREAKAGHRLCDVGRRALTSMSCWHGSPGKRSRAWPAAILTSYARVVKKL